MRVIIILAFALLLSGCNTISSVNANSGVGFQVRDRNYSEVWNAAVKTVSSQLTIVEANPDQGLIKAEKGVGLTTWGEVVVIAIAPQTPEASEYTVRVNSLKRSALQITGQDWTNTMIEGIKANLGL